MLSIRKWANSLPVGKDFTIPACNFLPVGKPRLQVAGYQLPDRILTPAGTPVKNVPISVAGRMPVTGAWFNALSQPRRPLPSRRAPLNDDYERLALSTHRKLVKHIREISR